MENSIPSSSAAIQTHTVDHDFIQPKNTMRKYIYRRSGTRDLSSTPIK